MSTSRLAISALFMVALLSCAERRNSLVSAAAAGDLARVQELLASGVDPNDCHEPPGITPMSPLAAAAANGRVPVIDALLRAGAKVEPGCGIDSPLLAAVANGELEAAKRLLKAGADVNKRTAGGSTLLMEAATQAQESVIPLLASAGCDVEATLPAYNGPEFIRPGGKTALMIAASWDPRPTRALIAVGAKVNARDAAGATPLIYALQGAIWSAKNGPTTPGKWDPSIVAMLLRAGADPNAANAAGETPLRLADQAGADAAELRDLLIRAGAK